MPGILGTSAQKAAYDQMLNPGSAPRPGPMTPPRAPMLPSGPRLTAPDGAMAPRQATPRGVTGGVGGAPLPRMASPMAATPPSPYSGVMDDLMKTGGRGIGGQYSSGGGMPPPGAGYPGAAGYPGGGVRPFAMDPIGQIVYGTDAGAPRSGPGAPQRYFSGVNSTF